MGGDVERIEAVAGTERAKGSALAERLSVFWGTRSTLSGETEGGRFSACRSSGSDRERKVAVGADVRLGAGLTRPGADELMVAGAEFALELLIGASRPAGRLLAAA